MVSAFRGVVAPAADSDTFVVTAADTPELTTGLNDTPSRMTDGPQGAVSFLILYDSPGELWSSYEYRIRVLR